MSSPYAAETTVLEVYQSAQQYAQAAVNSAYSVISSLAGGAIIDVPDSSVPISPAGISIPSMPSSPGAGVISYTEPTAPTPPTLDTITVPTVDIPVFGVADPQISIPDAPVITLPTDPGAAPTVVDVDLPADPAIVFPDAPVFDDILIPEMPSIITPNFEGVQPNLPTFDSPGNLFSYTEGEFNSPIGDSVTAKLIDYVENGGDISEILALNSVWEQARVRSQQQLAKRIRDLKRQYGAAGYPGFSGPLADQIRQAELDAEVALESVNFQVTGKQSDLALDWRKFAFEKSIDVVKLSLDLFNQSNARALEAAKEFAHAAIADIDCRVNVYNLQIARYQADAAACEAKIRAASLQLDAYKTAMDGARIRGELRQQDVALYSAKIGAIGEVVKVYLAQMQGAATKMEVQKTRLQVYETQVQAYVAMVNSATARINVFQAQVAGEKAKAEVYTDQVRAFQARVDAAKAVVEVGQVQANIVSEKNKSTTAIFQALIEQYRASIQKLSALVDAQAKQFEVEARIYDTDVRAATSDGQVRTALYSEDVKKWIQQATFSIEQAKLHLDWGKTKADINERALAASAQVFGQVSSAALSQAHVSASLGSSASTSDSTSKSDSTVVSTSTSDSTSRTNSYSTSYNYNQTASV